MTKTEFKIKYPQYAHLEGNELWDTMTEVVLQQDNVLHADPNQVKTYHEPIILANGVSLKVEDSSTTRWLNNKGEEVKVIEEKIKYPQTESYRIEMIDFSK